MRQETYYQVLQVDPKATQAVIEAAFRRLARTYHPDICTEQNEQEKMKELTAAYSVLRHPIMRVNYDKELSVVEPDIVDTEGQLLAHIGIVGSIIILLTVLVLSAFQSRSPAIANNRIDAAAKRDIAATDTANALIIRSAIVSTISAMSLQPTPPPIHATPIAPDVSNSQLVAENSIASNTTVATTGDLIQSTSSAANVPIDALIATTPANAAPGSESSKLLLTEGSSIDNRTEPIFTTANAESVEPHPSDGDSSSSLPLLEEAVAGPSLEPTTVPTLIPTTVPTLAPTVAPTVVPTAVPTTAPTATSFAAAVIPVAPQPQTQSQSLPSPEGVERMVAIIEPANNTESGGIEIFAWDKSFELKENQAVELVFWHPNQNPLQHGFGLAAPTANNAVAVDLDALDETLGSLLEPGLYRWGLLLVEVSPYHRLDYLGGGHEFFFANFGTQGSAQSSRRAKSGE